MNQTVSRVLQRLGPIIAVILGVVLIVFGSLTLGKHKTYQPVQATIESISVDYGVGEDDTDTYHVWVKYTVDGKEYHSELGEMQNGYHEGKEISVLYNPEKPEEIISQSKTGPIIAIVIGGVAALAGAFLTVRRIMTGR